MKEHYLYYRNFRVGMVAKKVRQIGVPSKSHPPLNALDWAVSPSKSSP